MKLDFWNERWQQNQIGFHMPVVNPHLIQYWPKIVSDHGSVFVPLCGKSKDLVWLEGQGHQVTGVECSDLAVNDFFKEHHFSPEVHSDNLFSTYKTKNLTIFQGDYFKLQPNHLSDVKYVFDRAALVALPENMRSDYVKHITDLLAEGSRILLITLEYDQSVMQGPPFSVSDNEVHSLYSDGFSIKQWHRQDIIQQEDRFRSRGLNSLVETVYCLQKP
jgi:thiopurine S-methyltransferase